MASSSLFGTDMNFSVTLDNNEEGGFEENNTDDEKYIRNPIENGYRLKFTSLSNNNGIYGNAQLDKDIDNNIYYSNKYNKNIYIYYTIIFAVVLIILIIIIIFYRWKHQKIIQF